MKNKMKLWKCTACHSNECQLITEDNITPTDCVQNRDIQFWEADWKQINVGDFWNLEKLKISKVEVD